MEICRRQPRAPRGPRGTSEPLEPWKRWEPWKPWESWERWGPWEPWEPTVRKQTLATLTNVLALRLGGSDQQIKTIRHNWVSLVELLNHKQHNRHRGQT
eukprot:9521005-Lingulodinium_polyedra.AAC.1